MEEWRVVDDYLGVYEVSNLGRVRSNDRYVNSKHGPKTRFSKGQILKCTRHHTGYLVVSLRDKDAKCRQWRVHILVGNAFLSHKKTSRKRILDHLDGDKENNAVDNLEWVTYRENAVRGKLCLKGNCNTKSIGVTRRPTGYYIAQICINGKKKHLGHFKTEEEAANSYRDFVNENQL